MPRLSPKKVPAVAFEIQEHGKPAVWLIAGGDTKCTPLASMR